MMKLSSPSSSTRQEFDTVVATSDRRAIKLLLSQLLAYAQAVNSKPLIPNGKIDPCILHLFVYSIPDDQIDMLRIDAKTICDRCELLKSLAPSPSY